MIDDGWLILSGFNPLSLMGLRKLTPVLRRTPPYNSRMFTMMRQLDWLSLLNFEVLSYGGFQVIPRTRKGGVLLSTHLPALGCMQFIVARKRTIPPYAKPNEAKQIKNADPPDRGGHAAVQKTVIRIQVDNLHPHGLVGCRRASQLVTAFVFRMTGVPLYPLPFDFVLTEGGIKTLPEIDILDRFFSLPFSSRVFSSCGSIG